MATQKELEEQTLKALQTANSDRLATAGIALAVLTLASAIKEGSTAISQALGSAAGRLGADIQAAARNIK
jgi:hypothetical protein